MAHSRRVGNTNTAFSLWQKSIPRLRRVFRDLDEIKAKVGPDELGQRMAVMDYELKANREVRETLAAEMRVRREIVELRKLELDGMPNDEVEDLLIRTALRRGYRHIDGIRDGLIAFLTPSLGADAASEIVNRTVPPVKTDKPTKRLERSIGQTYDRLQEDLEEGVRELKEALGKGLGPDPVRNPK